MTKRNQNEKIAPTHELVNREGVVGYFDNFGGDHQWDVFSNFHENPVTLDLNWRTLGEMFDWDEDALEKLVVSLDDQVTGWTGEHLFAAFKTRDMNDFFAIMTAKDPGKAKKLGRSVTLREDWELIKYDVMLVVLRAKFTLDSYEGQTLLDSGDALLVEGTLWRDKVWGVDLGNDNDVLTRPGRNWLGMLLMVRRAELVAEKTYGHVGMQDFSSLAFILR